MRRFCTPDIGYRSVFESEPLPKTFRRLCSGAVSHIGSSVVLLTAPHWRKTSWFSMLFAVHFDRAYAEQPGRPALRFFLLLCLRSLEALDGPTCYHDR